MPRVQVTMDEELYRALVVAAGRHTRTPANLARHAIRAYISKISHGSLPDALRTRAKGSENDSEEG